VPFEELLAGQQMEVLLDLLHLAGGVEGVPAETDPGDSPAGGRVPKVEEPWGQQTVLPPKPGNEGLARSDS